MSIERTFAAFTKWRDTFDLWNSTASKSARLPPAILATRYAAVVRKLGAPSFFITMTCNPKWPEIVEALPPGPDNEGDRALWQRGVADGPRNVRP